MQHPLMTKGGWTRLVKTVADLERVAAEGNTWGPETDARYVANDVIAGLRKDRTVVHLTQAQKWLLQSLISEVFNDPDARVRPQVELDRLGEAMTALGGQVR